MKLIKTRIQKDISLRPYIWAFPKIILFSLGKAAVVFLVTALLRQLGGLLLWTMGKPALISSDLAIMLRSFRGWLLMILGFGLLVVYILFDIHSLVLLSSDILHQKRISLRSLMIDTFKSIRWYKSLWVIPFVIYVGLLGPLSGSAFGISLTRQLYIPNFVTSVIKSNLVYRALYFGVLAVLFVVGYLYLFTFHYMILRGENIRLAMRDSRQTMKEHWKDFLIRYLPFLLISILVLGISLGLFSVGPLGLCRLLGMKGRYYKIFFVMIGFIIFSVYAVFFATFQMMEVTRIYESYTEEDEGEMIFPQIKRMKTAGAIGLAVLIACVITAGILNSDFDYFFPERSETNIVAHRAGGVLEAENSMAGIRAAIRNGVYGTEIDVRRTKDGHYIIYHDSTFKRLCGDDRRPSEMTLEEIKKLEIWDLASRNNEIAKIATLEEVLDAAKGKIHIDLELKGKVVDQQMIDDVYEMVTSRDMLNQVTFISLDYNMISNLETQHPEADTGYLCFAAFGTMEDLNCDALYLEEETATTRNIQKIHDAGKKVIVWTVNSADGMYSFLNKNVDGIITDDISLAIYQQKHLEERGDLARIFDGFTVFKSWL